MKLAFRVIFFGLLLAFVVLRSRAAANDCTTTTSPEVEAEITHLRQLTKVYPHDPVLLYNLATDFAAKCETATVLKLLHQVADEPGGLDPGAYRDFTYLKDNREFQAIVAEIRRKNPAKIQSKPAFVIKEPNLFPEGMAYARFDGRIYAGSVQRKIVWTDKSGELHELAKAGDGNLAYVAGLHVDESRKELWAVSSRFGSATELANAVPGLFKYDLNTGKRLAIFAAPNKSAGGLNDVTVAPSTGIAYTTNTGEASVYCAKPGSHELELFLPRDSVSGANGIALSDDEKTLFVAGDFGIQRVDLTTKTVTALQKPSDVVDASMDGLYFYRGSLVGIQNGIHPGRVVRFYLDSTLTKIVRSEILETYNPAFENPTTGGLDGDSLLFMANPQLHKWTPGKPLPPADNLNDIQILRISLAP